MSKDLSVSVLMDFYGDLLTQKQKDALDLYYNQDLSLAEIAEHMDISRQGVRDFIKRGEKQLFDFEDALGLVRRSFQINEELERAAKALEQLKLLESNDGAAKYIKKLETSFHKIKDSI